MTHIDMTTPNRRKSSTDTPMKKKLSAGDYSQALKYSFLPAGGIPKKLDKLKHVLIYLWQQGNIIKLGEVHRRGHGLTVEEAFEHRYCDGSGRGKPLTVLGLFVIPKIEGKPDHYDKAIHALINIHHERLKFSCPGKDGEANSERIQNFEPVRDMPALIELIENYTGQSHSFLKEFVYRNDTQKVKFDGVIRELVKTGRCLFNGFTGIGKSTCSPHIVSELCDVGEIAILTTPVADTLYDLVDKLYLYRYSKPIHCITNKDLIDKSAHVILEQIKKWQKTHIVFICLSVQNLRYKDNDLTEGDLRIKFNFLEKLSIKLWVRDEYHTQYNAQKTKKVLSNITAKMVLDLTASVYKLLELYNDYTPSQIHRADNLWALHQKKVVKNPDFNDFPDVELICADFTQALPKRLKSIFTDANEEYREKKLFECKNDRFVHLDSLIETFRYITDSQIYVDKQLVPLSEKKNKFCARISTSLPLKSFGLIRIPEGDKNFTAQDKVALLKAELNPIIRTTLFKTADDFLVGKRGTGGTSALLADWLKEANDLGKTCVVILTHAQLVVGTDIPPLSFSYLFDRISSPDVLVQFFGRLQRVYEGKTVARCYIMCSGMAVQLSSMWYQAAKDAAGENQVMQKEMYDCVSLKETLVDGQEVKISFEDAIKNNNIMLARSLDPVSDITTQYLAKFTGLAEFLSEYDAGKSIKDKFGNGKDSITQQTAGSIYVPPTEEPEDDDTGDGEGTEKQQQKRENVKFVNLSIMLRTVLALDVVNQQQSSLKQIWDTPLAKEWFKPEHLRLAKALFEFQGFFPSFSLWFEEKRTAIKSANVIDIVLDEHCFLNEKFLVGSGMVYVPRAFGEKFIEKVGQGNTFVVFNALNGMLPALLKIKYPKAKIVCIEHFSYFVKHLTNMGFETYLYTDKKWKTMKFDAAIMNPPYNGNLDLDFIKLVCKIADRVIVVHPAISTISRKNTKKFVEFKKSIEGHVESIKIFNGNPIFGIGLFYPCQIMVIDNTQTFNQFEVEYSLDNKSSDKYTFKSLFDVNKWGNITEYYNLENKILNYCNDVKNANDARDNDGKWKIHISGIRGNVCPKNMLTSDFYTFIPKDRDITKEDASGHSMWFSFETKEEAKNMKEYLKSDFARFCLSIYKVNHHLNTGEFCSVPYLHSYDEPWTEDRITKLFKITDAEWAFIKKVIPKYY